MSTRARKKRSQEEIHYQPAKLKHLDTQASNERGDQTSGSTTTVSLNPRDTTDCSSCVASTNKPQGQCRSDCDSTTDSPDVLLTVPGSCKKPAHSESKTKTQLKQAVSPSTSLSSDHINDSTSSPKANKKELDGVETSKTATPTTDSVISSKRLGHSFYSIPADKLAKCLLGQRIVRIVDGTRLCAKIVETEAYLGAIDKAAHSYKRKTDRNKAMFMQPGTAYVYNIYGMYCCLNISSQGTGCAVLIRSVEPIEGVEKMSELRRHSMKSASPAKTLKDRDLSNGPSKLCQALAITKSTLNEQDLVNNSETWLEQGDTVAANSVVVSARINIGYAEDWTDKPLRFYVLGNPFVSVRDKAAEKQTGSTS